MSKTKTISHVWASLEELNDQMTSGAAEGMTMEQLKFVDERLEAILKETSKWFVVLESEYAKNRAP